MKNINNIIAITLWYNERKSYGIMNKKVSGKLKLTKEKGIYMPVMIKNIWRIMIVENVNKLYYNYVDILQRLFLKGEQRETDIQSR